MALKLGFSTLTCPGWDVQTIINQAVALGCQGVEFRGLRGELHLPLAPELAGQPDRTRQLFEDARVEIVCLASSATLASKKKHTLADERARIVEFIELAGRLGCPFVRLFAGEVQRWPDNYHACLGRVASELIRLVPVATKNRVTLLIENSGDFPSSEALWFLVDAVSHPSVRACWNQCYGLTALERATLSLPRLGQKLSIVHVADADVDDHGVLLGYKPLGQGRAEVGRQIEILRGLAYNGYIMCEWPKMWDDTLPPPETALPQAIQFLRERIGEQQVVLTAYKGDKNAPKFSTQRAPTTLRG
jgi:fatty-acyl-CoA synthase